MFSVEDSEHWLDEALTRQYRRSTCTGSGTTVQPLQTVWHHGVPMQGWEPAPLRVELQEAELILIDSPALPPPFPRASVDP